MHELLCQWFQTHHLLADIGKAAVLPGHLEVASRRADRLGRQTGVGDPNEYVPQLPVDILFESARTVPEAKGVHPVEDETGSAIPEVVKVEDRVDHRGSVSC